MGLFSFRKKKEFFNAGQQQQIVAAIQQAEKNTSGEVRLFIESKCAYVDPVDRAREIFFNLKMENTRDRNAVLLYLAMYDRQIALFADEGIYRRLGAGFWNIEVSNIISCFTHEDYTQGICNCILEIGEALKENFPYEKTDKNELPDEITFGS